MMRAHLECIWGNHRRIGCGWAWVRSTATAAVRAVPGGPPPRRSPSRRHQHSTRHSPTSTQLYGGRPLISTWARFANGDATEARLRAEAARRMSSAHPSPLFPSSNPCIASRRPHPRPHPVCQLPSHPSSKHVYRVRNNMSYCTVHRYKIFTHNSTTLSNSNFNSFPPVLFINDVF